MPIPGFRITTASAFNSALESIQQRRASMLDSQEQMASGLRVNRPSDDPTAAGQAERIRGQKAMLDAEKRMVQFARSALQQADGAVSAAIDETQAARELLTQARNGTLSASDRANIAKQLQGVRANLLAIANRPDGTGGYIFGGAGATSAPFVDGSQVTYTSQTGQRSVESDPSPAISQDGSELFMNLSTKAGSTTLFKTLDDAIALLRDPNATSAQINTGIGQAMDGVDAGIERLSLGRTRIGEGLRAVEAHSNLIESDGAAFSSRLSDLVDIDYAKAISDYQSNQIAVDAAMKTYSQIAKMSLFQYL
jgi:flagellar hook-associated protein 3 FlgL